MYSNKIKKRTYMYQRCLMCAVNLYCTGTQKNRQKEQRKRKRKRKKMGIGGRAG